MDLRCGTGISHVEAMASDRAPECGAEQNPPRDGHQLCEALRDVITRYMHTIRNSTWSPAEAVDCGRTLDAALQYGLGLIRMLAEVQSMLGLDDHESVHLVVELAAACEQARIALAAAAAQAAQQQSARKPGCRWRRGATRRAQRQDAAGDPAPTLTGRQPDTGAGPLRMMSAIVASTTSTQR